MFINYLKNLSQWNSILVVIFICSIVAVGIFIERILYFRKMTINTDKFIVSLRKIILDQNIIEAIRICEDTGGTIASIIKAGLLKHDRSKEEIESSMEVAGLVEIAKLEKNARILSMIAHIAPLIGLLGTVLGFIQAFSEMRQTGLMDISTTKVGQAMEYALITTAAGLVVAIPSVVGYNYLVSRVKHFALEMQTSACEIVDLLLEKRSDYEI